MLEDWFENELTGDVYYNSEMSLGEEGTGAMEGEGWVHLGENGMFSGGTPTTSDASVIGRNAELVSVGSLDYDDGNLTVEASFKGDNAPEFMSNMGYKQVKKQSTKKVETMSATGGLGGPGEVRVTLNTLKWENIEKKGYVPNNQKILGSHRLKTIKPAETLIGGGITSEIVQYRYEWGVKSQALKVLDALIKIGSIQSGNIEINQ